MFLKNSNLLIALLIILGFSSCKKDEPEVETPNFFINKAFVLNEGPFGTFGSISALDRDNNTIVDKIYQGNNDGDVLGDIVQSMSAANDKYYVVVNNSNSIKVIDAKTFKLDATIENLELPRYMVINGTKGYLSQWGTGGANPTIAEIDLTTNTITKTVATGNGPEKLIIFDDKLLVPCAGGFGRDSVLQIFDLGSLVLDNTIVVGDNPKGVVVSSNNNIWVSGAGYSDWAVPTNNTSGHLVELDPSDNFSIVNDAEITNGSGFPRVSNDGNSVYYHDFEGIHKVSTADIADNTLVVSGYFYGFDIEPANNNIYCTDAKDFQSPVKVIVYDPAGTELRRATTGIIPSHFYFVD